MNNTMMIIGVLAVVGIVLYATNKKPKADDSKFSSACGCGG